MLEQTAQTYFQVEVENVSCGRRLLKCSEGEYVEQHIGIVENGECFVKSNDWVRVVAFIRLNQGHIPMLAGASLKLRECNV